MDLAREQVQYVVEVLGWREYIGVGESANMWVAPASKNAESTVGFFWLWCQCGAIERNVTGPSRAANSVTV